MEILSIIGIYLINLNFLIISSKNISESQRHAYTLHIVESKDTKWEKDNWIMRAEKIPFRFVHEHYKKVNMQ